MMTLLVMYGSRACEHDVSIITAVQAMDNLDPSKYFIVPVYIDRDGTWYTGDALRRMDFYTHFDERQVTPCMLTPRAGGGAQLVKKKTGLFGGNALLCEPDCALLAFHGMNGEDGTVQGLLELYGVPYTSAGVLGSATGMDKIAMKLIYKGCGLPVLDMCWFERGDWEQDRQAVLDRVEKEVGYPAFVKPANLGSSVGIHRADDRKALEAAVADAEKYTSRIIVEHLVEDLCEINCSVLGNCDDYRMSVLEEPIKSGEILSYEDKYMGGTKTERGMQASKKRIPADLPADMTERIKFLAGETFRVLSCHGVSRVDFIVDRKDNSVYVNEINTIPGSLSFYLWEATGLAFDALMDELVRLAFKRKEEQSRKTVSYSANIFAMGGGVKGAKGAKGVK